MNEIEPICVRVPAELAGMRLDRALAVLLPDYSRNRLQQWLREGLVRVDRGPSRGSERVRGGEVVEVRGRMPVVERWEAQAIPVLVLYEDADVLVVDKPAGLVVHPAAGNPDRTLVNALLHRDPDLARLPRSGIVHRLDKDTSGLLVVARTPRAHRSLVEQLREHAVVREYEAVATGVLTAGGTVDAPIGRDPRHRTRMAVTPGGRPAVTHYRVVARFRAHTHARVRLETGRTHQVRVHLAYLRHPLAGDPVYGGRLRLPAGAAPVLVEALRAFRRQALHAARLELAHPADGAPMAWESPLPADLRGLLEALAADAREVPGRD
ncbi:MAG: 23S rRNA pseudouridine(1911/1915/1917) synthase RluD [Gammaproteobacteria bacterium]|jgi:23S rRNA pseudouridine1911/1915/1917 synthase|nr:23S rRNA pseudouridine(1911/1915/1917) synthase RluD [Gammaproteobacteria bacterium]